MSQFRTVVLWREGGEGAQNNTVSSERVERPPVPPWPHPRLFSRVWVCGVLQRGGRRGRGTSCCRWHRRAPWPVHCS
jgi:hypothetical protein